MNMWFFRGRKRGRGGVILELLLFFLLVPLAPVAFTGCNNGDPEIDITVKSDYGKIIEAVNSANKSLTEKMSLIEAAMSRGFADNKEAQVLLQQAVSSLSGTLAEKLAALETAVKGQTASLETKLGLIDAAVSGGFADSKAQQALIHQAVESLSGTLAEKLAAIETAVKGQTSSLDTKLALIETAVTEGLADDKAAQELLRQAIGSLTGTLAERLQAVGAAMEGQASSLAAKLDLIETTLADRLTENNEALALIVKAVESLGGTLEEKLAAIDTAVQSRTAALETKLSLIEAAAKKGFADDAAKQALLLKAVETLSGTADTKLTAIAAAVESQASTLSSKLGLIDAAVKAGLADSQQKQTLIANALASLNGTLQDKLSAIETVMKHQTDSLSSKIELIQQAWATGLASDTTAVGLIKTAVASLQDSTGVVTRALTAIDDALQADGGIGQILANIVEAVRNADCHDALLAITRTLRQMSGRIDGHEFVDMGGMFWATCNVGASDPKDIGDYFAWGETETKTEFTDNNYKFGKESPFSKYNSTDGKKRLEAIDDAASESWGSAWHIPTRDEWKWLYDNTVRAMDTTIVAGIQVVSIVLTSKVPGYEDHRIVLPYGQVKGMSSPIVYGYWSSVLPDQSYAFARIAFFTDADFWLDRSTSRRYGCPVRPVATNLEN